MSQAFGIGDRSVFQAELYGIRKAALWILEINNRKYIKNDEISVYTDNQAVLKALKCHFIKSDQLWRTIKLLNAAAQYSGIKKLRLGWVKGHAGYAGNELADKEAKRGLSVEVSKDIPLISEKEINTVIKLLMYKNDWEPEWQRETWETRQTRMFYPYLRPKHSWEMLNQARPIYSVLVQLETGHNYMKRHEHIIAKNNGIRGTDPICSLCGEGEESSAHILAECTALKYNRLKYFNCMWFQPPYVNLDMKSVINFLREANMEALNWAFNET